MIKRSEYGVIVSEYLKYRPEIDGLRAVAVLAVIFFHAGIWGFHGGFVGVDVFFVISGYLITRSILDALLRDNFSYLDFYERRARRILPALYFVMLACIPFAYLWLFPMEFQDFGQSLFAVATFMSNVLFWREAGYFETAAELKPLLHTWSLSVEEQFYLIFPLILVTMAASSSKDGCKEIFLASLCLFSLAAAIILYSYSPTTAFYWLPTRIWELLIGVLIAVVSIRESPNREHKYDEFLSLFGLALIIWSIIGYEGGSKHALFGLYGQMMAAMGAGLAIYYGKANTSAAKLLSYRPLVWVGLISFSIYLWNQPILAFYRQVKSAPLEASEMLIITLATILLGYLTYRYVERPFRNKRKISKRYFLGLALTLTSMFIALGLLIHTYKGFPGRVIRDPSIAIELGSVTFFNHLSDKYSACRSKEILNQSLVYPKNKFQRCMQSKMDDVVDTVIVGDSHAEHLFPGIADALPNDNVAFYVKAGLPVFSNPDFSVIYDVVGNDENIKTVILSAAWSVQIKNTYVARFENELAASVTYFLERGKKVVLVDDVPYFEGNPESCVATLPFLPNQYKGCEMPLSHVETYEQEYVPILRSVADGSTNTVYVGLRDLFCKEETCSMMHGKRVLYRDNDHLSLDGSHHVATRITESIAN